MLHVIKPGLQSTLQGAPRVGKRHYGLPYSGPADALSMTLANRLVANTSDMTCLEITYGGFEAEVTAACAIAVTGAHDRIEISGAPADAHATLHLKAGDMVFIAPPRFGARTYLAIHSGFKANVAFGSTSTYLPAGLGGHDGRALQAGDTIGANNQGSISEVLETPDHLRPVFSRGVALRTCHSAETALLPAHDQRALFQETFIAGRQATRMGVTMAGNKLAPSSDGMMKSAPVFPGTIQCPPSGVPVLLLCDAQTTGGYPRIASVARCDQHLLGQIRPGDSIQLLQRSADAALRDYAEKLDLFRAWLSS